MNDYIKQSNQALVKHGEILLTVNVKTEEDAEQILRWMYATEKPMSAELLAIAWDKVAVSKKEGEVLGQLREIMRNGG